MATPPVKRVCHDLKTDPTDIGSALPGIARLIPTAFYLSILGAIGLGLYYGFEYKKAEQKKIFATQTESSLSSDLVKVNSEKAAVDLEALNAEEVQKWVNGSDSIQEIVATIVRSMRPNTIISSLELRRDARDPKKISLVSQYASTTAGAASTAQVDYTSNQLATDLRYRPYSPNVSNDNSLVTYSATLIRQQDSK
jgi:hypothetical protein